MNQNERITAQGKLLKAMDQKDLVKMKQLLAAGADPNWADVWRAHSPMQAAAEAGFIEGLQCLLDAGGDVNVQGLTGRTPLIVAASKNEIEAGRWLLHHGADVHFVVEKPSESTALLNALSKQHLDFATMLLQERPALRERELHWCAPRMQDEALSLATLSWLLREGVTPNVVVEESKLPWLALFQRQAGDKPFSDQHIDLLLSAGADANFQDHRGNTALHEAVDNHNEVVFRKLLHAGANPDIPNSYGLTPRSLLDYRRADKLLEYLRTWEASCTAHKIIQDAEQSIGWKPL